jgi:hypothetical protein
MEERNPQAEKSTDRRDPKIPAARESPEKFLRRRRWQFGERRSGGERRCQEVSAPRTPPYIG